MTKNLDFQIRLAIPREAPVLSNIAISAKRSNGYSESSMDACREELTVTADDMSIGVYWVAEANAIQGFFCLMENSEKRVGEIQSFIRSPDLATWGNRQASLAKKLWNE